MKMYENEANLKESLFKFKNLMDEHGIEFVLAYGTLLGAYRDKRLLPWDVDIDIDIIFHSYEDFVNADIFGLLRDAYKRGFRNARWAHEFIVDEQYLKYPKIALLPEKEQWKEFLKIDPVWKTEKFGMCWCCNNLLSLEKTNECTNMNITVDCIPIVKGIHIGYNDWYNGQQLGKITLYDDTFNTPSNLSKYFVYYYGKSWNDIYCSYDLWQKYGMLIRDENIIPQEIDDFTKKWKPLLEDK